MKTENGIAFPDGTDQSANFRHKIFTDENGENFYLFPVRVKDENDLKTFGVNKTARWTLPFGPSPLKYQVLYFVAENEELAEDFWKKINTEHSQESRNKRCLIPGKLRPTIICPESNKCSHCPYPECRDKHEMREIVYDDEIKVIKVNPHAHKLGATINETGELVKQGIKAYNSHGGESR
ncbi:MAG: hypothetical protein IJ719_12950 [Clostridia bacterium]|nr:hypothetical protein [Clostridia bacterium]